jgi:UDPglucose 6-dehydrogenase
VQRYFEKVGVKPFLYDKFKNLGSVPEVNRAEVIFVCVPTPYEEAKSGFDLSAVAEALHSITGEKVVVLKSTVLPGMTEELQKQFPQHKILFNPEFLTQSTADNDMMYPDRQIVGYTKESYSVAGSILRMLPLAPFERVIPATEAELVKYFGNTWFSVKVVFANQMYDLAKKLGADYDLVRESVSADKRIGPSHLEIFHGGYRGYGGACLPKDTLALIQFGERIGAPMELLKQVHDLNCALRASPAVAPESGATRPRTTDNKFAPPSIGL